MKIKITRRCHFSSYLAEIRKVDDTLTELAKVWRKNNLLHITDESAP